jgi:hypothetical protein
MNNKTTTTDTILAAILPELTQRGRLFLLLDDPRTSEAARVARLVDAQVFREPRAALFVAIDEFAAEAIESVESTPRAALFIGAALPACSAFLTARGIAYPAPKRLSHLLRQIVCRRFSVGYSHNLKKDTGCARGWHGLRLRSPSAAVAVPPAIAAAA